jgi:hypothetical protein
MKSVPIAFIAFLGISATAFGSLSFTLDPVEVYPPGANLAQCELYGVAPCVVFSGTLTDTDTDGSIVDLYSLSIDFANPSDSAYFTLDNTFFSVPPGVLSGDPGSPGDGNPISYTYTGPIFGLDIAPFTPAGLYDGTAILLAYGGTNDPNDDGFTVDAQFTVAIGAPEPAGGVMILTGLFAIVAFRCSRRARSC